MNGQTHGFPDFMVPLNRNGHLEDCYFDFSYSPIADAGGEIQGVLVICMETTEKVKALGQAAVAQAAVSSESDKLTRFFLQAPAGICILDGPELTFELINPLYQQLFPGRDLLHKPLLEAVPEVRDAAIWDVLQNVYTSGETFEGRELLIPLARTTDGPVEDRYFNFIYQARKDHAGNTDGILVFVIEVTEIVQTKRRIEENASLLETQLNALPQIAWTSAKTGDVTYFNHRWYEYTGLTTAQSMGWDATQTVHPDDLQSAVQHTLAIVAGNSGGEFEGRYRRTDGEYRWHLLRMVPIKDGDGQVDYWLGTATDIHDLKLLQQQKDDFISIASHELKTPITSLKASLQLLDRMKDQPSPVMLPKLVEQANKSIDKVSTLVEDLLNSSKANAGQLHLNPSNFVISQVVQDCCNHVRSEGKFEIVTTGEMELQVYADSERIDQVMVNLVNNAVKYAANSREIQVHITREQDMARVTVTDQGPGIPAEKLPHLFERYYRVDSSGKQISGLGLGLYISAEIIRKHGGQIGVESELGKGAAFWFTLPVAETI
jgi:PAS domain S-box-containing protein